MTQRQRVDMVCHWHSRMEECWVQMFTNRLDPLIEYIEATVRLHPGSTLTSQLPHTSPLPTRHAWRHHDLTLWARSTGWTRHCTALTSVTSQGAHDVLSLRRCQVERSIATAQLTVFATTETVFTLVINREICYRKTLLREQLHCTVNTHSGVTSLLPREVLISVTSVAKHRFCRSVALRIKRNMQREDAIRRPSHKNCRRESSTLDPTKLCDTPTSEDLLVNTSNYLNCLFIVYLSIYSLAVSRQMNCT